MTDTTDAMQRFQTALEQATTETQAFDALCALTKATAGAKLFTVMTADMDAMLARRVYTDDAENYPTSGTKEITIDTWFEQVHGRQECFVANTLADIDAVFPDAELIGRLGCASVVNLPIIIGGKMVATRPRGVEMAPQIKKFIRKPIPNKKIKNDGRRLPKSCQHGCKI